MVSKGRVLQADAMAKRVAEEDVALLKSFWGTLVFGHCYAELPLLRLSIGPKFQVQPSVWSVN